MKLLDKLGEVERHGESFPVLPTIPEDATATTAVGPLDEVAGQDEDNVGPEEADLEPDKDDSDYEEPAADFEPTKQQKADLQIAHENSGLCGLNADYLARWILLGKVTASS